MRWFRICKWEKYQHYGKPNPAWLKIYTTINDPDTDWRELSDAQIGQLIRLIVYASRNHNTMIMDNETIKELLDLSSPTDLNLLENIGIIESFDSRKECQSMESSRQSSRQNSRQKTASLDQRTENREERTEKKEQKKNPAIRKTESQEYLDQARWVARQLAQGMLNNDENAKLPRTEKQKNNWLDAIEKINRLDGYEWTEIIEVTIWCQKDEFWSGNIMSGTKLRKQFPKLRLEMKRGANNNKSKSKEERNAEILQRRMERDQ